MFTLPENCKIVEAYRPTAANGITTSDVICCKNIHKLWAIVHLYGGGGDTDNVFTIYEATDVAAGTNAAITAACPYWQNTDTATSDSLTKATTDAYSFTMDTGAGKNQILVVEFDPAKFSAGYDCFYLSNSGGNASNMISGIFVCQTRYAQNAPPTVITD